MLKYLQTKMFLAGIILTKDQMKFGDFRSCFSIFNKSTKLQKNRKGKIKGKLTWRLPTGPPAGPAQLSRQRAAWLGQAGTQVLDGELSVRHADPRRPASPPRRPAALDALHD